MTFRDPEAARRACVDPSPVIDGRRANCNLASLGRPRPPIPFGIISQYMYFPYFEFTYATFTSISWLLCSL